MAVSFPIVALAGAAEDSKEVITLKRDLAQERVARIQMQLNLMQQQFKEGQQMLQASQKELESFNAKLKALEPKTPVNIEEEKKKRGLGK